MNGICHVFGAGPLFWPDLAIEDGDCVIAADAGYRHVQALGLKADVLIGDFDSLGEPGRADAGHASRCFANGPRGDSFPHVIRLNPVKDETDVLAALMHALDKGYRAFRLYGCAGGRMAHTLANIGCLNYLAERGARGFLYADGEVLTAVKDGSLRFGAASRGPVSVFALSGECRGVTETGLKYALDDYALRPAYPIGVSNEFIGRPAEVSVREGTLLIVYGPEAALS